jgi:hypothetical protein
VDALSGTSFALLNQKNPAVGLGPFYWNIGHIGATLGSTPWANLTVFAYQNEVSLKSKKFDPQPAKRASNNLLVRAMLACKESQQSIQDCAISVDQITFFCKTKSPYAAPAKHSSSGAQKRRACLATIDFT